MGEHQLTEMQKVRQGVMNKARGKQLFEKINIGNTIKVVQQSINGNEKSKVSEGLVIAKTSNMFVIQLEFGKECFSMFDCIRDKCDITILDNSLFI